MYDVYNFFIKKEEAINANTILGIYNPQTTATMSVLLQLLSRQDLQYPYNPTMITIRTFGKSEYQRGLMGNNLLETGKRVR